MEKKKYTYYFTKLGNRQKSGYLGLKFVVLCPKADKIHRIKVAQNMPRVFLEYDSSNLVTH